MNNNRVVSPRRTKKAVRTVRRGDVRSNDTWAPQKQLNTATVNKIVMALIAFACLNGFRMSSKVMNLDESLDNSGALRGHRSLAAVKEENQIIQQQIEQGELVLESPQVDVKNVFPPKIDEEFHVVNEVPVAKEIPVVEDSAAVEVTPVIDVAPVKSAPIVEVAPVVEVAPIVKEAPVIEAAPIVKEAEPVNAAPIVESVPIVNAAPIVQQAPIVEEVHVAKIEEPVVVEAQSPPEPKVDVQPPKPNVEQPPAESFSKHVEKMTSSERNSESTASKAETDKVEDKVDVTTNDKQTAVVHVGLLKADSSVIKQTMTKYLNELKEDGYEVPGTMYLEAPKNAPELGFCYYDREAYPWAGKGECAQDQFDDIKNIAERGDSILLSSDNFGTPFIGFDKVKSSLESFEQTRVVMYYTRFYEYVYGIWEQLEGSKNAPHRDTFVNWTHYTRVDQEYRGGYTLPAMYRWKAAFPNLEMYNMYDSSFDEVSTSFFCNVVHGARKTCEAAKKDPVHKPKKQIIVYKDLAYYAKKELNLVQDPNWSEADLAELARKHQEELGLAPYYFPDYMTCPEEQVIKSLLEKTLRTEKYLFKKFYRSGGEEEIRKNFETDMMTKLCTIDAKAVLENSEEWRQFFRSIGSAPSVVATN